MLFKHKILNSIWLMDPGYAVNYLPLISAYLKGETFLHNRSEKSDSLDVSSGVQFATRQAGLYHISDYGGYSSPEEAPEESVAVIHINGAITKHDQYCGPAGMLTKANLLHRCDIHPNVKGIIIKQETGGGEGSAMRLFNEAVSKCIKPVLGFVDDYSCSAGMGNLAACDMIIANNKLARIGSIGTYLTIADYTEHFAMEGIKLIDVYATASKDKNSEYYEALKGNLEPLREIANVYNDAFLELIETQRGDKLKADRKEWGTGKVYFADKALDIGLIDAIDSFDNVLNYLNT